MEPHFGTSTPYYLARLGRLLSDDMRNKITRAFEARISELDHAKPMPIDLMLIGKMLEHKQVETLRFDRAKFDAYRKAGGQCPSKIVADLCGSPKLWGSLVKKEAQSRPSRPKSDTHRHGRGDYPSFVRNAS